MKIMVPTAGSGPAKANVKYIVNIAKKLGGDLLALHIQGPGEIAPDINALEIFNREGERAGVPVWRIMWKGDVVDGIIMAAEKEHADLIVMGASKGNVVKEWLSSNVAKISKIPVVIIPHEYSTYMKSVSQEKDKLKKTSKKSTSA